MAGVTKNVLSILLLLSAHTFESVRSQNSRRDSQRQILAQILDSRTYDAKVMPTGPDRGGPVNVTVSLYFRSIQDLDDKNMEMKVQLIFRQQWLDTRLNYSVPSNTPGGDDIQFVTVQNLAQLWRPDLIFSTTREERSFENIGPNSYGRVFPNGEVLLSQRISLTLSCPMKLKRHPFDRQTCSIRMVSGYGYTTDDITFEWKKANPVQFPSELYVPGFALRQFKTDYCGSTTNAGSNSCLKLDLSFKRDVAPYVRQMFVPSIMFVIVAYFVFWLDQRNVLARILLSSLTLFAATGYTAFIDSGRPQSSHNTASDTFIGICLMFIFSTLVETIVVHNLVKRETSGSSVKRNDTGDGQDSTLLQMENSSARQSPRTSGKLCGLRNFRSYLTGNSTTAEKVDLVFKIMYPSLFISYTLYFFLFNKVTGESDN